MSDIKKIEELLGKEKELILAAIDAQAHAYCPYSDYPVGAAVLSESGQIQVGWNVETVSFSESTHAEQNAICRMLKDDRIIKVIAFVSKDGGAPCGHCRQIISEFAAPDIKILGFSTITNIVTKSTLSELLPFPMKTGKNALKN
ncbi:MAG: cytidine deaminase [Patescibacteria group bacterium]